MNVINYFSLDIFQRLQHWRTSEDVNNSSLSGSRPRRKAAEKISRDARHTVSTWHTKMVAQNSHDTPTATRHITFPKESEVRAAVQGQRELTAYRCLPRDSPWFA